MPASRKFPPTVEIKRVIAAAERAGIEIASIEIQPGRVTLHARTRPETPPLTPYDIWKMSEGESTSHSGEKTDALPEKSKG